MRSVRAACSAGQRAGGHRRPKLPLLRRAPFALVVGLACAGCGVLHANTSTVAPPRTLNVVLNGQPSALYAPLYVGAADGAFARGALSVSLSAAGTDAGALSALSSGRAQVAVVSEPAVLAARASGERIVAIGALANGPLEAMISLHKLGSAKALAGKTVATDGTQFAAAEVASYLASGGVTPTQVHLVTGQDQSLLSHRAYALLGRWDLDAVALALARRNPSVVRVESAGVPSYTDLAIVVRVHTARYQGALLRAFLQSVGRAEAATRANPTAAAQVLVRANPGLTLGFELAALSATQGDARAAGAGQPFGYQNPVRWQAFGAWMAAHSLLRTAALAGDTITDEFLPGQGE